MNFTRPRFVVTPGALVWSPIFGLYHAYLTARVAKLDRKVWTSSRKPRATAITDNTWELDHGLLQRAMRAKSTFSENVSFSMIVMILAEINGAPTWLIHTGYAALLLARAIPSLLINNSLAMAVSDAINSGIVNLGLGAYNLWAGYDALVTFGYFVRRHGWFVG